MSKIYTDLNTVLTPYATAIKKNASDITSLNGSLGDKDIEFDVVGYIGLDGKLVTNQAKRCTDFIPISDVVKLKVRVLIISSISTIAFYDAEKVFISKMEGDNNTYFEDFVTCPENTAFVRVCNWAPSDTSIYAKLCPNLSVDNVVEIDASISALEEAESLTGFFEPTLAPGGYIGKNDGNIVANNYFSVSDFVNVESSNKIIVRSRTSSSFAYLAFYDRNKKFISALSEGSTPAYIISEIEKEDYPANACYIRASTYPAGQYYDHYLRVYYDTSIINVTDAFVSESNFWKEHGDKHGHCIEKPFDFNNKKAVAFGDSITYGTYSTPTGTVTTNPTDSFIKLFCDDFGMTLDNKGSNSAKLQSGIKNLILNYNYSNKDFVFIAGGTNDFNSNIPLGAYGDTTDETFYGVLDVICQHLATAAPDAKIIFISPIPYTDGYYDRVKIKYGNNVGSTLAEYRNAIFEVATQYGYSVVNGGIIGMPEGSTGGWNNVMCADNDGCHPTILGHHLYCDLLKTVLA